MTTTTTRDLSTTQLVIDFLEEVLPELSDWADAYGEPGYSLPDGLTPLVVFGNYWCRCDKYEFEHFTNSPLHHISVHHEAEFEVLDEQGVEFEWLDEWVTVHEYVDGQWVSNAYRTEPDSYHWQPSALMSDDGEWLTRHDSDDIWMDWAMNDHTRAIPAHMLDAVDPTELDLNDEGEPTWFQCPEDGSLFENGWHPGQTDDPETIAQGIRAEHGDDTDVVFVLNENSQFYLRFSAYYRPNVQVSDESE